MISELQFGRPVSQSTPGHIEFADELEKGKSHERLPSQTPVMYVQDDSIKAPINIGSSTVGLTQAANDLPIDVDAQEVGLGQAPNRGEEKKPKKKEKKAKPKATDELDLDACNCRRTRLNNFTSVRVLGVW